VEKVRPWCGQPPERSRQLKNSTEPACRIYADDVQTHSLVGDETAGSGGRLTPMLQVGVETIADYQQPVKKTHLLPETHKMQDCDQKLLAVQAPKPPRFTGGGGIPPRPTPFFLIP